MLAAGASRIGNTSEPLYHPLLEEQDGSRSFASVHFGLRCHFYCKYCIGTLILLTANLVANMTVPERIGTIGIKFQNRILGLYCPPGLRTASGNTCLLQLQPSNLQMAPSTFPQGCMHNTQSSDQGYGTHELRKE